MWAPVRTGAFRTTGVRRFPITQLFDRLNIRDLSIVERIQLVYEFWDSIAEERGELEITEAQRKEIDGRRRSYRSGRHQDNPWEVVRNRIQVGYDSWLCPLL